MNITQSMKESRNRSNRKAIEKRKANLEADIKAGKYPNRIKRAYQDVLKEAKRYSATTKKKIVRYKRPNALSKKRAAQNREYLKLRTQFLKDHPKCQVYPLFNSEEIHHKKGRIGKLLTDTRYWLAVSRTAHDWIGANPKKAYELGYSLKRLAK